MSKRFQDFLNQSEKPAPETEGIPIDGAFACTVCHYQCDEALWNPVKKTLIWVCPEGHENKIPDFKGF